MQTKPPSKAAAALGIGATTVYRRLDAHGIKPCGQRGVSRKLPPTIVAEYQSGMSLNAIARKYSACSATVYEALSKAGFTARRRGGVRKRLAEETTAKVVELYGGLKSQEKVARRLGLTQAMVSRHLIAAKVPTQRDSYGANHASWKGGRIKTGDAGKKYWAVYVLPEDSMSSMRSARSPYVMEHRLVVARWLGRPLDRHETVHHINGNTEDNRLENLQLRSGHHGSGVVHRCRDCGSSNIESARLHS